MPVPKRSPSTCTTGPRTAEMPITLPSALAAIGGTPAAWASATSAPPGIPGTAVAGGNADGMFLIAHTVSVNLAKTLTQLQISSNFLTAPNYVVESRAGGQNYSQFATTGGWDVDTAKKSNAGTAGIGRCCTPVPGRPATRRCLVSRRPSPALTEYRVRGLKVSTPVLRPSTSSPAPLLTPPVYKNQRNDSNGWQDLGTYLLNAGTAYTVTIDAGGSSGGVGRGSMPMPSGGNCRASTRTCWPRP